MYPKHIKRWLDFSISFISIILLCPLMGGIALLVRINLGKPVFFYQHRPGLNEKIFKMYKFRSMTDTRDNEGNLLPDEKRLTSFGKWLRSTSLDELPELFNILKGDMSIVGPRPLLVQYLPLYNKEQKHRHDVRPGLTGLAQVNGRNTISWETRFNYDIEYVNNISFAVDIEIVLKTIMSVLKKEGISSATTDTMEEFRGNT